MAALDKDKERLAEMKGFGSASSFGDLVSDDDSLLGEWDQVSRLPKSFPHPPQLPQLPCDTRHRPGMGAVPALKKRQCSLPTTTLQLPELLSCQPTNR